MHAWINLLSLGNNLNAPLLKKYGVDILTRNLEPKAKLSDYKIDNQYFLEPGDSHVRNEVLGIVKDVILTYPELDGIQLDYIRYPDVHPVYGYTPENIERFKKATGLKTIVEKSDAWQNWKRTQVTELVEMLVKEIRAMRPKIQISTTGCAPYERAYYEAFQDWPSWIKLGLVDFVTVMSYPDNLIDYKKEIEGVKSRNLDLKRINFGVPAYKLIKNPKVFSQLFDYCQNTGGRACVVFHYGNLLENPYLSSFLNKRPHMQ